MFKLLAYTAASLGLLLGIYNSALALENQWYVGVGGGSSQLQAEPTRAGTTLNEDTGSVSTVFFGRDIDTRSSGQFQFHSLGEASFNTGQTAEYIAADASLLYRFYDSRDNYRNAVMGASFYGRFGFGLIDRDSPLQLATDAPVYFGAGAGVETYFTRSLAIRLEALYHDVDTASATLAVVARFGGGSARPVMPPTTAPGSRPAQFPDLTGAVKNQNQNQNQNRDIIKSPTRNPQAVTQATPNLATEAVLPTTIDPALTESGQRYVPEVEVMILPREIPGQAITRQSIDTDNDGIDDASDACRRSQAGYPVDATGCSLLQGFSDQLVFNDRSAALLPATAKSLQEIAALMKRFPKSSIELVAHTDNRGSETDQSNLTRQRLRTLGTYLVTQGIGQDRLLLRSFGGKRPIADNGTAQGREANNRIEVLENP